MQEQLNSKFYLLDSLTALKKLNFKKSDFDFLTKKEKKEIKFLLNQTNGFKLDKDSLSDRKIFPASTVFNSFEKYDSASEAIIKKIQPFYIISNPVFFSSNNKALILVILSKDAGCLYFLNRKLNTWEVFKTVYLWM